MLPATEYMGMELSCSGPRKFDDVDVDLANCIVTGVDVKPPDKHRAGKKTNIGSAPIPGSARCKRQKNKPRCLNTID